MSKQKYTVLALFAVIMIDALGWGIAFPVLAPILLKNTSHMLNADTSLAAKNFFYELSLGIYCLFMFIMSPILGSLSDKYGRKKILVVSMLGNFLGFLISGLAIPMHSFAGVLIGRSIAGATAGSLPIAQAAMIDISEDSQKASRLGLVVLANVLGFAIGPVIGGFFMDQNIFGNHISYQVPFFVSCGMALLGALLVLVCFKETFIGNKQLKINVFTSVSNLHQAFTTKETFTYCAVLFCFLFGWAILFSTIPVFLTERLSWSGSSVGYFITYIGILFGIIVIVVMPKITKLFSLSKVVFTALIILFLCNLLFPTIRNSIFPWIVILLTAAVPFTYVGIVTLLSMEVDGQKQGQIMGVTGSIFAFTWGVGPMLAGFILKVGLTTPYILAGIFFLLAILLFRKQKVKNEMQKLDYQKK
jgi:MFS transporter, DHA1 family, tetracycline resistance protein